MNNTILVEYKGGGYDGCFWEWNYFLISNGEFYNIKSTGRYGIQNMTEAIALVKNEDHSASRHKDAYIYSLASQKEIDDFTDNSNAGNVVSVLRKLVKRGFDDFKVKCPRCGKYRDPDCYTLDYNAYRGDGGIGISYEEFHCENCESEHSCSQCGEYMSDQEEKDARYFGECESCKPEYVSEEDYTEEELAHLKQLESELAWLEKSWLEFPVKLDRAGKIATLKDMILDYENTIAYSRDERYSEELEQRNYWAKAA